MTTEKSHSANDLLANFIIESDSIEGIVANPGLVNQQIKNKHTEGHVGALLLLNKLAEDKQPLTHQIIQDIQGLITAEQSTKLGGPLLSPKHIGKYRLVGVQVGGRVCPHPNRVPVLMALWLGSVATWQRSIENYPVSKIDQIANFHFSYEFIHPFADGNGRSGRAIVYYMMRYCGLTPFIFTAGDRFQTYYPAFKSTEAMVGYFRFKAKEVKTI